MIDVPVELLHQSGESLVLGMGDYAVTASPGAVLCCIGLGSCIAICVYDHMVKIGGMVHVVLPHTGTPDGHPMKYANTAVPFLLQEMIKKGGVKDRLTIKIAGGAQMALSPGLRDSFRTGERNLEEIKAALQRERVSIAAGDTGGNMGRTVRMYVDTGKVTVRTIGGSVKEL
jgi:chemotaxis protein CheD